MGEDAFLSSDRNISVSLVSGYEESCIRALLDDMAEFVDHCARGVWGIGGVHLAGCVSGFIEREL